ncbi:MAG: translation initiation factor IF-3 [Sweet potato little leaf phytoplasma]|uniref:Translation initiation factor IF-3 n=2 Tax=Candidatus Phytoplasma TaxID=33926 RepID=A0AAP4X601_9MOLU|nr:MULTISPECIES: translation initiation factor IF-3 [16SrII (Peanut WB group)]MDO8052607.1 translation initiation factor IF-3 ['Vigna radiata' phytoplasma]MDO7986932.1 translation initiation factor IF-3 [Sweet potato little leaf phytoplasma]MDO8005314.1 translation initiation factor IF-3 [Sweet potato little leaf phytoplasma]MDO8008529.1 translation initiation factor IF-3 [Sweet potato little leaf phytoplasma]MDO8020342.1 translation initiation factor IF-3 [Sweet potato little leaf phytoplasma
MSFLYNEKVPAGEYLVIDSQGKQLGLFQKEQIFDLAKPNNEDFVLINAHSDPKVVRLVDYSKFYYEQQKKIKQNRKKQHNQMNIKTICVSPRIQDNDLDTKMKKAKDFLKSGQKVKINMSLPGRMAINPNIGIDIFKKIISSLSLVSKVDIPPKIEGNQINCLLIPLKSN